jgi:hypothetical protein
LRRATTVALLLAIVGCLIVFVARDLHRSDEDTETDQPGEAVVPATLAEGPDVLGRPVVDKGVPKLEGNGTLERLPLSGTVATLEVSPDEGYVFVDVVRGVDVVIDAELRIVSEAKVQTWGRMAFTRDGKAGLWPYARLGETEIRTLPDLSLARTIERPDREWDRPWVVCALPDGETFVVAGRTEVRLFFMSPPRWGNAARAATRWPHAGAVDPETGLLLMVARSAELELFDPMALKSVATMALPQSQAVDVVATGGHARVGTDCGEIFPVDLKARRLLDPIHVDDDGEVRLAVCRRGRTLAAVARQRVAPDHHPTRVVVYEIEGARMREIAAATFVGPCAWNDVAVLPDHHIVIIGGYFSESFVWTYAPE